MCVPVKLNSMCGSKKKLIGISDSIKCRDSDLKQQCEDPMVTDSLSADVTVSDIDGSLDGQDDWLCVHCSDSAVSNYMSVPNAMNGCTGHVKT